MQQANDVEDYEEHRKGRLACRLEQDDRMYEHIRQQRATLIADSDARLKEVRRQLQDRARNKEDERRREVELQRFQRVERAADKNAYESHNAAGLATATLARAQAQPVGVAHCVATPRPAYACSPRQSQNASPRR